MERKGKEDYKSTEYDRGRLLTVQIDNTRGRSRVCTNVYNHAAAEVEQRQKVLPEIGRGLENTSQTKTAPILRGVTAPPISGFYKDAAVGRLLISRPLTCVSSDFLNSVSLDFASVRQGGGSSLDLEREKGGGGGGGLWE